MTQLQVKKTDNPLNEKIINKVRARENDLILIQYNYGISFKCPSIML